MNSFGGPRTLPRGCGTQVLISLGLVLCPIYRYTLMQCEAIGPCSVDRPPDLQGLCRPIPSASRRPIQGHK